MTKACATKGLRKYTFWIFSGAMYSPCFRKKNHHLKWNEKGIKKKKKWHTRLRQMKYLSFLRGFESKPSNSGFVLRCFTSKLQCIKLNNVLSLTSLIHWTAEITISFFLILLSCKRFRRKSIQDSKQKY